jgi:hypothetical protein
MSSQLIVTHPTYVVVAIDHQMIVIQVQIGKNFIDDVLLDAISRINIIMEKLWMLLGLSKPNPIPYNL